MIQADDGVRWANLIGSILLFWGSYRGQKWAKTQAAREDRAAKDRAARESGKSNSSPGEKTAVAAPGEFDQASAEVLSRPMFDRKGYILLCVGFGFTTLASLIDILDHTIRGHRFFEQLLAMNLTG